MFDKIKFTVWVKYIQERWRSRGMLWFWNMSLYVMICYGTKNWTVYWHTSKVWFCYQIIVCFLSDDMVEVLLALFTINLLPAFQFPQIQTVQSFASLITDKRYCMIWFWNELPHIVFGLHFMFLQYLSILIYRNFLFCVDGYRLTDFIEAKVGFKWNIVRREVRRLMVSSNWTL